MKNVTSLALLAVFASTVLYIAVRAKAAGPLPDIFRSVLTEVKAKTKVPVLLPTELPFVGRKHASIDKAIAGQYAISVYVELGQGNEGFIASFGASENPRYSPQELPNVRELTLATGITGFFRPVNCGGSCAPANLWWREGSVLYQI